MALPLLRARWLLMVLLGLASPSTAQAAPPVGSAPAGRTSPAPPASDQAAILPIEVRGASDKGNLLPEAMRASFAERMAVVKADQVRQALGAEPDPTCITGACASRLATLTGARWLARAKVLASGGDYQLEISVGDGVTGQVLGPLRDRCVLCGWAEVGAHLATLARAAASRVEEALEAEAAGAAAASKERARAAATPSPAADKPPEGPRPSVALTALKWVTAGVAVGLLATSAVLFAYDGKGTCTLPPQGAGLLCPQHYATGGEAAGFLAGGVALGAVSGVLFWLDARRAAPAPAKAAVGLAPTLSLSPDGFALGAVGRF